MKENLPLWKMATLASPESFGALPAPAILPTSTDSTDFSNKNDLEDIMPPDWEKYNYALKDFDSALLSAYAQLKQRFPGIYVNVMNGKRVNSWCGLRSPDCTIGAAKSAHKTGKALDLHMLTKADNIKLYEYCQDSGLSLGIKRIETRAETIDKSKGNGWIHIDVMQPNAARWKDKTKPYIFVP